ncbi:SNF2 family domain-containing protein [Zalerion maritima]|uniref:Hsp90 chaperone protein kinase-targeting subunit n=1 Tax=Zalerion maritima TaxID=339359 RepID=A0AAD5RUV0_9PEZI|nr:SNF2 family domain-containing protein [Zalerion maritima]
MPVDYSKWDALELSDDSDVEVHPNVDKRSFIRAKQAQIHAERQQRKHQIETLKYERIINDQLMRRISGLLDSLKSHAADAKAGNPGEVAFRAVFESTPKNPADDAPPPRPEGVHTEQKEPLPSYTKMMATLLDQVNQALEEKKPADRYEGMLEEVGIHLSKVEALQKELLTKLADLEKEEGKKITSEGIHTGFNSSHVAKAKPSTTPAASEDKGKKTDTSVELLNPSYQAPTEKKTTADAAGDEDDSEVKSSAIGKRFGALSPDNYSASLDFLSRYPEVLAEKETDALLIMAFDAELEKRPAESRSYVHQALLLQYCRALGKDGVALFFRRISTPGHQARDVFFNDVKDTYGKIKGRAAEILAQSAAESGGVEQIQLHAMEPGTVINIRIPPAGSDDPEGQKARAIFDGFKPEMKEALESGELDKVNKVLGEMKVEDAEELVGQFGDAGILSLEEQIIDATTEEGKKHLEDMEEERARELAAEAEAEKTAAKYSADPE